MSWDLVIFLVLTQCVTWCFFIHIVQSSDPADKDAWKDKGMGQLSIKCKEGVNKGTKESKPTIIVRNDVRFLASSKYWNWHDNLIQKRVFYFFSILFLCFSNCWIWEVREWNGTFIFCCFSNCLAFDLKFSPFFYNNQFDFLYNK